MIFPMVANGNIAPFRFVKQDTSVDNKCLQGTANSLVMGVSQRSTRRPPGAYFNDDGYAAIAGESVQVYSLGETCEIELGGTVAAGDRLKSDGDGKGVTASTGNYYGFIAGQAGTSGQLIEGQVMTGTL